jgi:hypothetical protein
MRTGDCGCDKNKRWKAWIECVAQRIKEVRDNAQPLRDRIGEIESKVAKGEAVESFAKEINDICLSVKNQYNRENVQMGGFFPFFLAGGLAMDVLPVDFPFIFNTVAAAGALALISCVYRRLMVVKGDNGTIITTDTEFEKYISKVLEEATRE